MTTDETRMIKRQYTNASPRGHLTLLPLGLKRKGGPSASGLLGQGGQLGREQDTSFKEPQKGRGTGAMQDWPSHLSSEQRGPPLWGWVWD